MEFFIFVSVLLLFKYILAKMILITGSTGFIGGNLVRELSKLYKLRCIVRKKNIEPINNVELFYADVLNKKSLEKAFEGVRTVIHLAAITSGSSGKILKTNIEGTKNLVELSREKNIEKFILVSTDNVNLGEKGPYAASKLKSEAILLDSKISYVIIRPNWVYDSKGNKDLKTLISLVKNLPIVPIIGNGSYKLQPVHVKDVVSVIIRSLSSKNKIYSIGGSEVVSFNELIDEIAKSLNLKRKKIHIPIPIAKLILPMVGIPSHKIKEMTQDKLSNNENVMKDFKIKPVSIKESLSKF